MTRPRISPAAFATITRPLIFEDGRYNRAAICRKARREFRAGHARNWSEAMRQAWRLARMQLERARQYDDTCRAFYRSPVACRYPAQAFQQFAM